MSAALILLIVVTIPAVMYGVVALVIVCRAEKTDLPAIARALANWRRKR